MNKSNGVYKAHSPSKKVVLIDFDGEDAWCPVNDAVLSVLTGSSLISKEDEVEVTFGDGQQDPDDVVVFIKSLAKSFNKKGSFKPGAKSSFSKSSGGFRSDDTQTQIMRQNAMNRVVDLICAGKVEFNTSVMEEMAEGFVKYFKTGALQQSSTEPTEKTEQE